MISLSRSCVPIKSISRLISVLANSVVSALRGMMSLKACDEFGNVAHAAVTLPPMKNTQNGTSHGCENLQLCLNSVVIDECTGV